MIYIGYALFTFVATIILTLIVAVVLIIIQDIKIIRGKRLIVKHRLNYDLYIDRHMNGRRNGRVEALSETHSVSFSFHTHKSRGEVENDLEAFDKDIQTRLNPPAPVPDITTSDRYIPKSSREAL